MRKLFFVSFFSLALIALVGCSNKVKLSGKVTFSDDGSPLTTGTVHFENDQCLARGKLQSDGSYVLGSESNTDGLPAGKYFVYVAGAVQAVGKDKSGLTANIPLITPNFTSRSKSTLSVDVSPSLKTYDFKVDRFGTQN